MPAYDVSEISTDPAVLLGRLAAYEAARDEILAGRSRFGRPYESKAEAKAAARRGQTVREVHGLSRFFLDPPTLREA